MDESKLFFNYKTDKDDSNRTENKIAKSSTVGIEKLAIPPEGQRAQARGFSPKLKSIFKKEMEFHGERQEKLKGENPHQGTSNQQIASYQNTDNLDNSSAKKNKHFTNIVSKYRKVKTNAQGIIKRIKSISLKDEVRNEKTFQNKSSKIFTIKKKYIVQVDQDVKLSEEKNKFQTELQDSDSLSEDTDSENTKQELFEMTFKNKPHKIFSKKKKYTFPVDRSIEISKEKGKFQTEPQGFTSSMSSKIDGKNAKPKFVVLKKFSNHPVSIPKYESTSAESNYLSRICKIQPKHVPKISPVSTASCGSSKVRSAKEVLEHFRQHMQSFDSINTGGINEEDMDVFSKQPHRHSKDRFKAKRKISLAQDLRQKTSETSATGGDDTSVIIQNTRRSRQRIVHDENVEFTRNWVIQQIKDKEIVLRFTILEGKCAKDVETKERCIEKAKRIQSQIDTLFDTLDDHDKFESVPQRTEGFWRYSGENDLPPSQTKGIDDFPPSPTKGSENLPPSPTKDSEDLPRKATKRTEDLISPEGHIDNFLALFQYLYKSLCSQYEREKILERINIKKFFTAYGGYLIIQTKHNSENKNLNDTARDVVEDLYLSLEQCRSIMKCKITRPEIRTLKDYQSYINDLIIAVNENLNCLHTVIPEANSVIFPLMSYLSESRSKIVDIFTFLNEKHQHLISEYSSRNRIFFENFCRRYFKCR